jgi:hypothetical protein
MEKPYLHATRAKIDSWQSLQTQKSHSHTICALIQKKNET